MRVVAVCSVLCLLVVGAALAPAETPDDFADWTAVSGSSAQGTIHGVPVTLSGDGVLATSTPDASAPIFDGAAFTPPLPHSDAITFAGAGGHSYELSFGRAIHTPVLHLASRGSTLHFPAGTQITR